MLLTCLFLKTRERSGLYILGYTFPIELFPLKGYYCYYLAIHFQSPISYLLSPVSPFSIY